MAKQIMLASFVGRTVKRCCRRSELIGVTERAVHPLAGHASGFI